MPDMSEKSLQQKMLGRTTVFVLLNCIVIGSWADIYSSTSQVKHILTSQRKLLDKVRAHLSSLTGGDLGYFQKFYQERLEEIKASNLSQEVDKLHHPNQLFLVIKDLVRHLKRLLLFVPDLYRLSIKKLLPQVLEENEVSGAILGLLRIQEVYRLNASHMVQGLYLGHQGPALTGRDIFQVAARAFKFGRYQQCINWLELAVTVEAELRSLDSDSHLQETSRAYGLMGRALVRLGQKTRAQEIYKAWKKTAHRQIKHLAEDLKVPPKVDTENVDPMFQTIDRLCASHGRHRRRVAARLVCRTRGWLPYFRFREEILSESPFISVFYDVITDNDSRHIISLSQPQMTRSQVVTPTGGDPSQTRTSQLAWLADADSPVVRILSRRVAYLTGLNTSESNQGFLSPSQSSSENFGVVNYGIGGHFSLHKDHLEYFNRMTENILTHSGNRIATFLIYLSEVPLGGYTVFPKLNLVVKPIKNSAVFWYNYDPAGQLEDNTWHAGCPVIIGDKWITNKWILSYGNTFSRRCGLTKDSTQMDIDPHMMRGYRTA